MENKFFLKNSFQVRLAGLIFVGLRPFQARHKVRSLALVSSGNQGWAVLNLEEPPVPVLRMGLVPLPGVQNHSPPLFFPENSKHKWNQFWFWFRFPNQDLVLVHFSLTRTSAVVLTGQTGYQTTTQNQATSPLVEKLIRWQVRNDQVREDKTRNI